MSKKNPERPSGDAERLGLSRRRFLSATGAGAVALATTATVAANPATDPLLAVAAGASTKQLPLSPTQQFVTEPLLDPPALQVTTIGATPAEGFFFSTPGVLPTLTNISPNQAIIDHLGQAGLLMSDVNGEPVWFKPLSKLCTNFQVQQYMGKPVLTYWEGTEVDGIGLTGTAYILNGAYEVVATVNAANGFHADLHEFTITSRDTALVTAYKAVGANLTSIGGPKNASLYVSYLQEIDIATGDLLFQWKSLDHVGIEASYIPYTAGAAYDYFHINSICEWDSTSYLISARNVSTIFNIDSTTGNINWRLGGKSSDFTAGGGATFAYQHHARPLGSSQLTVFDDAAAPPVEPFSRGLILNLDVSAMTVTLAQAFKHPTNLLAFFEGSMQVLDSGNVVVGFGSEPNFTEFAPDGTWLADFRYPTNVNTYRAERFAWSGRPSTKPKMVCALDGTAGYALFLSWNGATEVASWRILTGATKATLSEVFTIPKAGFETVLTLRTSAALVSAQALNTDGIVIGQSPAVAPPKA